MKQIPRSDLKNSLPNSGIKKKHKRTNNMLHSHTDQYYLHSKSKLSKALQPNRANLSMYNKLHSYRHAILQGRKSGQCEDYFDKCSTNVS